MIAILKFDLNEPDEQMNHLACVAAQRMAIALWIIKLKHSTPEILEIIEEIGIDLDELTQ